MTYLNSLITLDTAQMLSRTDFIHNERILFYYCDGMSVLLTHKEYELLRRSGSVMWQAATITEVHDWLTDKNISVEPFLKAKRDAKTFVYEVNIIDLTKCCVAKTITVEGTYNTAMKKGIEQAVYDLTK